MAAVLVTGGSGNIGSFIVDQLVELGHTPIIVDNFYNGKWSNIEAHIARGAAILERVDITSTEMVDYVFEKYRPEYVSHQASLMILDSRRFPRRAIETNVLGTFNVIDACARFAVKKLTYASSASVYGNPRQVPVSEDHPFDNMTLYGATKIAKEALMNSWAVRQHVPFVGFRYFNIYSERQGLGAFYTQVFQKWIHSIHAGEEITLYGDGSQTLDLVHSSDAAKANILAMFNVDVKNCHFNVGTGVETSLLELLRMIEVRLGKQARIRHVAEDPHLVRRRCASTEAIREALGFAPSVSVEEGVDRYVTALLASQI